MILGRQSLNSTQRILIAISYKPMVQLYHAIFLCFRTRQPPPPVFPSPENAKAKPTPRSYKAGQHAAALSLHQQAALAEHVCRQSIAATKYAAALTSGKEAGIEGAVPKMDPRRPYEAPSKGVKEAVERAVGSLTEWERGFGDGAWA
jgi:hypothetical protein